jgi:hypothetical protein
MDKEKLQRGNELAEIIKNIKDFLEVFPSDISCVKDCQIKITYNVILSAKPRERTIWAGDIPTTFWKIQEFAMQELSQYEKEFEEL